jgi:RHS repeat-associated protein
MTGAFSTVDIAISFQHGNFKRGFTGHEHIDDAGLIHMNGRVYDARLGRFMSADPIVSAGDNLQAYNRYSYVLNNPLNATDPSGYTPVTMVIAAIAAVAAESYYFVHIAMQIYNVYSIVQGVYGAIQAFKYDQGLMGVLALAQSAHSAYSMYVSATNVKADDAANTGSSTTTMDDIRAKSWKLDNQLGIGGNGVYQESGMASNTGNFKYVEGTLSGGNLRYETILKVAADRPWYINFSAGFIDANLYGYADTSAWGIDQNSMAYQLGTNGSPTGILKNMGRKGLKGLKNVPGRVQSRINISNKGFKHVTDRHMNPSKAASKSQFTLSQSKVRELLSAKSTIQAPARALDTGNFSRTITTNGKVGNLAGKFGGGATNTFSVVTDRAGNLLSAFPGKVK